jgi:hypothetical protein
MRIALCFWGLCRSTHLTIQSLETHIFKVLQDANIKFDTYVHTYTINKPYTNPRSGEFNLQVKNTNWKYLNPKQGLVQDQENIDRIINFKNYRSKGNPWEKEKSQSLAPWHSLDNHLRALWSLKLVTKLWSSSNEIYDWILYLRPDVKFSTSLDVSWFTELQTNEIGCPNFHLIKGCNDRFAICSPKIAERYGNRFDSALEYSKTKQLHAETFLADIMVKDGIQFRHLPIYFVRIRADGEPSKEDMKLLSTL